MDGKRTIKLKDGKPWSCKNGHIIGVMKRERMDGFRGYILYFLTSADVYPVLDVKMEWAFRAQGTVHDLQCQQCGCEKTWWAGKESDNALVAMTSKKEEPLEPLGKEVTNLGKYGPAMNVNNKSEANEWFEVCVQHAMSFFGKSRSEAEAHEKEAIAFASYFGFKVNNDVLERVERLFDLKQEMQRFRNVNDDV